MLRWDEPLAIAESCHQSAQFGPISDLEEIQLAGLLVIPHVQVDLVVQVGSDELHLPVVVFHELLEDLFGRIFPTDLFLLIPVGQELFENEKVSCVSLISVGLDTGLSFQHHPEVGLEHI